MDDGIRKAAILVSSLGPEAVEIMLRYLGPAAARHVRLAIRELGPVDRREEAAILREFLADAPPALRSHVASALSRHEPAAAYVATRDLGLAQNLASGASAVAREHGVAGDGDSANRFAFLRDAEDENLAVLLASERPQTIALVLSHMPPNQAGKVLTRFQPELQTQILRRLMDLEETDEDILQEIENALETRIADHVLTRRRRVAGLSAVSGILEHADTDAETQIIANLHQHDRELAERLRPNSLTFDDVLALDDDDAGVLLASCDPRVAIMALAGAPEHFVDRILGRLSEDEAKTVRHQLHHLAPTRLRDIEDAKDRLVELAYDMAVNGRLHIPQLTITRTPEPAATVEFAA